MSIETVFPELNERLTRLREAVVCLRLTVVEDKPIRGDLALIDLRSDAIDEMSGRIEEAIEEASRGQKALRSPQRLDAARQALSQCQQAFNALSRRFRSDLVSYERMAEVIGLARERGREWHAWAVSVQAALRQCEQPLHDVEEALFTGWREISSRTSAPSVTVRSSSIGQRVVMKSGSQGSD